MVSDRDMEAFFAELGPRIETAEALGRDLDQHLARRFNTLHYLRNDELGLSRIMADLLDPLATHGQGWLFLGVLLELVTKSRLSCDFPSPDAGNVKAFVEIDTRTDSRCCISLQPDHCPRSTASRLKC